MAEGVSARLTPGEGRRFAFPVGIAFLILAGISYWRGHHLPPRVLAVLGIGLFVAGVFIPGRLGPVYRGWMGIAHGLSRITTPIFLGVVYFLVLTPIGLLMRLFGRHPMRQAEHTGSYWASPPSGGRSDLKTQF